MHSNFNYFHLCYFHCVTQACSDMQHIQHVDETLHIHDYEKHFSYTGARECIWIIILA